MKHTFLTPGQSRQLRLGNLEDISFDCSKDERQERKRMKQFQMLSMHLSNQNELLLTMGAISQKAFTKPKSKNFCSTMTNST